MRIKALMREIKPDLVQTWLPQMDILGGFSALSGSVPWVVSERASELAYRDFSWLSWLRRRLGRYARAVVANSAAGAIYWRRVISTDTCLAKIPNAIDVAAIRCSGPMYSDFLSGDKKLILVVGRLTHQKAVETTIQAISLMADRHDFRVLIIGDGPKRKQLEAMVTSFGINDRVVMLPFQADWWGGLKIASILVSMSRYEGHPNVVLEAIAAGCPLVVSDIPEHREFLDEDSSIMVQVENPVALADAISSLLSNPESARQRADHASIRVDGLTLHSTADAYESVYKKVISRRGV
jgi:glycosyltransferase involved in cell wall biosynthesis